MAQLENNHDVAMNLNNHHRVPTANWSAQNSHDFHNAINKLHSSATSTKGSNNYGFGLDMGMESLEDPLSADLYPNYHTPSHARSLLTNGQAAAAALHTHHSLMVNAGSYMPNHAIHHSRALSSRRYNCKMCTSVFDSKTEYQMHFQSHMREPKPYKCSQCPKCFANSSYLSQHMRIHLGIKPYGCETCKKKFTQLSHLQQHSRTHTGDKPYRCPASGCTKAFSQLSNLQSHSRCHQTDKPYKCNSCYKCFYDEQSLHEHIPKHKDSKHLKTHICQYCGKSYTQETYLARHMAKHLDKMAAGKVDNHHRRHHHDTLVKTNGDIYFPGKQESPPDLGTRGHMQEDLFAAHSYANYPSPYNPHLNGYSSGAPSVTNYDMMANHTKNPSSAFCIPTNRSGFYGYDGTAFNMRAYGNSNGVQNGESKSGSMGGHFGYDGRVAFGGMPTMVADSNRASSGALKDTLKQQRY